MTTTSHNSAIELLSRSEGTTITDIVTATGWSVKTVPVFLSKMRKSYTISKTKVDGVTLYKIVGPAVAKATAGDAPAQAAA